MKVWQFFTKLIKSILLNYCFGKYCFNFEIFLKHNLYFEENQRFIYCKFLYVYDIFKRKCQRKKINISFILIW